jgi:hypothetical protein
MQYIQQEIKFFWPLTEQIPLDLIYENCNKPLPLVSFGTDLLTSNGIIGTWTTSNTMQHTTINCDQISFQTKKKQTFLQRLIYKAMGIKIQVVK